MVAVSPRPNLESGLTDEDFARLQFTSVLYYLHSTNPDNGLVRDKTQPGAPASIAAIGMALATIPVVVERGVLIREFAVKMVRRRLEFLMQCHQGPEPDASGYKGFFYHFLDIETGQRVWECELSTIDSAFLFAGALTVATYFDGENAEEAKIRTLATALYERADWNWARDQGATLTHGWRPESGFIPYRWRGYDEGLLLYILGLGSPSHPLPPESYEAYTESYEWRNIYGASCSIPVRCSPTSYRICGSISEASAISSCTSMTVTTSRTAGKRPLSIRSMRSEIRCSSRVMVSIAGDLPRVTARAG